MERAFATPDSLGGVVRAAFGGGPAGRLAAVHRLAGGSKKGVYRLTLAGGSTAVLYVWAEAENYWPAREGLPDGALADAVADPFSDASGIDLHLAARSHLDGLGVRIPRLLFADPSRTLYPADVAVVEDVPGPSLQTLIERDPQAAVPTLRALGAALRTMHAQRSTRFGKVLDGGPDRRTSERVVLDRALGDLAEAAPREERIAASRDRLERAVRERAAAVRPRERYGLVHGELGPDHVLVDGAGQPVVIDIEGLMFFDVEWEHAFLRLRFGEHYRWLADPDGGTEGGGTDRLDGARLRFYELAMYLSLVAGPLRILDTDYPERDLMREIADANLARALACTERLPLT